MEELKIISQAEKNKQIARKSIVAKEDNKGEKFTRFNLTCKRPGNGISPMNWYKVIGEKKKKIWYWWNHQN